MRSYQQNKQEFSERAHDIKARASGQVEEVKASLHRRPLGGGGDWDKLEPGVKPNKHQFVAAKTGGYLTLANVLSVTGAALTGYGLYQASQHNYTRASIYVFAGRALDMVDGKVAQLTGTCSDKGAAIDAGLDKALAIVALPLLTHAKLLEPVESTAHVLQQSAIFYESVLIKNHGDEPNPGEHGKKGTAALWARVGGSLLSEALHENDHSIAAAAIGSASVIATIYSLNSNGDAYSEYNQQRLEAVATMPNVA